MEEIARLESAAKNAMVEISLAVASTFAITAAVLAGVFAHKGSAYIDAGEVQLAHLDAVVLQ